VANDRGIHSGHVYQGPCTYIKVLGLELLELILFLRRKLRAYSENSLWVTRLQMEQLGPLL